MALVQLLAHERLALVGLIRLLVRQDGVFSAAEEGAIQWVSRQLGLPSEDLRDSPYRSGTLVEPLGPDRMQALLRQATETLPREDDVRSAALRVERPSARQTIYDLVFEVAASDTVQTPEWPLLDWLRETWELDA